MSFSVGFVGSIVIGYIDIIIHSHYFIEKQRLCQKTNYKSLRKSTDTNQLQILVACLESQLAAEQLRNRALNIMLDIGKEDYGLDLRKKHEEFTINAVLKWGEISSTHYYLDSCNA